MRLLLVSSIAVFLVAAARLAWRSEGGRRALFAGLGGAAAFALIAEAILLVRGGPAPVGGVLSLELGIFIFGAHPALLAGFVAALGLRPRGLDVEALIDGLLLIVAAVILSLQLPHGEALVGHRHATTAELVNLAWRSALMGELFLLALLLAWRGDMLGVRMATGLTIGTVAFAFLNALHGQAWLRDGRTPTMGDDPLWLLVLAGYAIGFARRDDQPPPDPVARAERDAHIRTASIVVAILIASASAVSLGFRNDHRLQLATAVAVFGGLLAVRVGHALVLEQREARQLASRVRAERELSATLEHRVAERTAELAEAQRILQRMLALGQQITLELHPERVLQRFMEAVVDVAGADGGLLGLVDEGARIRLVAVSGDAQPLVGRTLPRSASLLGRVIRTGQPWTGAGSDIAAEGLFSAAGAVAIVPLMRRREVIGAVAVASRAPRHFSAADLAHIGTTADMLSVALANAELVENLRQAEWRFRTLFRAAPDPVLTVLQSGRIREANDAVREVTGLDAMQIVGRLLIDLTAPDERERLSAALEAAFAGIPQRLEVRFRRDDGATRIVALAASRLPEAEPPTVLCVGRDITTEREMTARLVATDRLVALGELVAGVAHEVNNPLSSISAFAQLLLREQSLTPEHRESVEVIRAEALRASQVVKDLLAFARRSEPRQEPVDLNQIVERSLRLRGYQITEGCVRVERDLAPDLPPVTGDPRQLQQVVLNLVTNALQAMAPNEDGVLRIATRADGDEVILEVGDTGHGIPDNVRPHVFEPFFTTKREGEGTGLGLSVSYGIVVAHGGSITIGESSLAGTTFVVTLPVASGEAPPPGVMTPVRAAARTPRGHRTARSPIAGIRLLFVDDEAALRSGMETFAKLRGFAVVTAADGMAALDAVRTTAFDAVVCDLRMPIMDGMSFHDVLRREQPGLAARTIFVTGDVLSTAQRFSATMRPPTVVKPFTFERIEEAVSAVLRGVPIPPPSSTPSAGVPAV